MAAYGRVVAQPFCRLLQIRAIMRRDWNNVSEGQVGQLRCAVSPRNQNLLILNGFRVRFGGRFGVWRELRQVLGKEFPVKKCSKLPGDPYIIRCHQMRVAHCGLRIHVPEAFLSNGHRNVQRVQQRALPTDRRDAAASILGKRPKDPHSRRAPYRSNSRPEWRATSMQQGDGRGCAQIRPCPSP